MELDHDTLPLNSNLKCHVCGENEFEQREGFYYCQECGTKQEQVRMVEVDREDDFNPEKLKTKKQKINKVKLEKPQLTSWECYNYILRGFVEELLSFGAKEELKLMTLQVWAAYLRRMEVAFFNRKQSDLPKLSVKYLQVDAETIYNHSKEARKKRQRRRSEDASCTSGGESRSGRDWRKSKRKLDESNYSLTSATSGGSNFTTSTSANSNRAIKIDFNAKARAFLKRKMPAKHIEKHAADADGKLSCHKQPNAREINRTDYNLMLVNTKQIYSILAIALNLINDEIQLSDLVRFINEGHIGTANVLQYFPENVANNGKEMLKKINFYKCPEKYSDKALREHIGIITKNIGIHKPKNPDLIKLVRRYLTELCLNMDLGDYIERLINLLPPQFESRAVGFYPAYEARAMAYIIFTLKLLYGLDGTKEHRISKVAQKLNTKIELLNRRTSGKQPLLFVWNEWVEYIEMRKIIVSQFNSSFCEQFKQCQSTNQLLEQMAEDMRRTDEQESLVNDTKQNQKAKTKLKNFKMLFERFQETYKHATEEEQKTPELIEFKPTFTPALSYFKNILLFCDRDRTENSPKILRIPDYMRIDHAQRDINSFMKVKPLIEYFRKHKLKLKVHQLDTTKNKNYVGIFRPPRGTNYTKKIQQACFDVTEEEWAESIMDEMGQCTDDLEFKENLETYVKDTIKVHKKRDEKKKDLFNPLMNYNLSMIRDEADDGGGNKNAPKNISDLSEKPNEDLQTMHSFELFNENNMDPDEENIITKPRRNLDNIDLFEGISDEESVLHEDDNLIDTAEDCNKTVPTPPVLEEFIKEEPLSPHLSEVEKENYLKFYISNMDCWMLLGSILMLTKPQKTQLQDKFPRSFSWLLETCAQTINVDWWTVYEQLLCIEVMFCLGIQDPKTIKNCVYINNTNPYKDIQNLINSYREIW